MIVAPCSKYLAVAGVKAMTKTTWGGKVHLACRIQSISNGNQGRNTRQEPGRRK